MKRRLAYRCTSALHGILNRARGHSPGSSTIACARTSSVAAAAATEGRGRLSASPILPGPELWSRTPMLEWVPGSVRELLGAEEKLLAFVKAPHQLIHVNIGPPPDVRGCTHRAADAAHTSSSNSTTDSNINISNKGSVPSKVEGDRATEAWTPPGPEAAAPALPIGAPHPTDSTPAAASRGSEAGIKLATASCGGLPQEGSRRGLDSSGNCHINTLAVGDGALAIAMAAGQGSSRDSRPRREVGHSAAPCAGLRGPSSDSGSARKGANLVVVHGYAACLGVFFRAFDELSKHFNVFAVDQLGWGASSRPAFTPEGPEEAEAWFVESLEQWRQEMGVEEFMLLGHSFGGYVASRYALKYPERVQRLILAGPAGFGTVSARMHSFRQTWRGRLLELLWEANYTPQTILRLMGPWSEGLVKKRAHMRWGQVPEPMQVEQLDALAEYLFQTLMAPMSGELCMKHLFSLGAFARRPLVDSAARWSVPTSFIYGEDDFMDYRAGLAAAKRMPVPADLLLMPDTGHIMFLERPKVFSQAVVHACRELLPEDSLEVAEASREVMHCSVPIEQDHAVVSAISKKLVGASGARPGQNVARAAREWGIG